MKLTEWKYDIVDCYTGNIIASGIVFTSITGSKTLAESKAYYKYSGPTKTHIGWKIKVRKIGITER